ncbi:MAG TPA: hypothetical protein VG844_15865 [Terracidiphilus sp.]|jgi:hypothetical protein|nr:hypothetical protein [Terracidiphilus sp.]
MEIGPIAGIHSMHMERKPQLKRNIEALSRVEATIQLTDEHKPAHDEQSRKPKCPNQAMMTDNSEESHELDWTACPNGDADDSDRETRLKVSYFA